MMGILIVGILNLWNPIHEWMAIAIYGTMARVKIYAPPKMNQFDWGLWKNMDTWHENEQNVVVQASTLGTLNPSIRTLSWPKFKSKRIKIRGNSILPSIPIFP
jgi:hypothetical protein